MKIIRKQTEKLIDHSENKSSGVNNLRSLFHVFNVYVMELALRSSLLAAGVAAFVWAPDKLHMHTQFGFSAGVTLVNIMWLLILLSMVQKFFPQASTSVGSRKHFKEIFQLRPLKKSSGKEHAHLSDEISNNEFFKSGKNYEILLEEKRELNRGALLVLLAWIFLNAIVGVLYFTKVINQNMLVLISMFYFLSDMICLLIYCPFQIFLMNNRCCVTCRIFNWDSIMICTPLLFIPGWFSLTLCSVAFIIFIHWEINFHRYPERFSERFNSSLHCAGCKEKLCRMKDTL